MEGRKRRDVLAGMGAGLLLSALPAAAAVKKAKPKSDEGDIGPAEDLMREHGLLRRVMYLYDGAARRLEAGDRPPLEALGAGAGLVHKVIEDYHEKLEENFVFPRLEKAKKLTDLTATLRRQHEAGRTVTANIIKATSNWRSSCASSIACTSLTPRARTPCCSPPSTSCSARRRTIPGRAIRGGGGEEKARQQRLRGRGRAGAELEEQFGLSDLDQFTPR